MITSSPAACSRNSSRASGDIVFPCVASTRRASCRALICGTSVTRFAITPRNTHGSQNAERIEDHSLLEMVHLLCSETKDEDVRKSYGRQWNESVTKEIQR